MTSTNLNIDLVNKRSSSRVLKPGGNGHTNIFEQEGSEIAVHNKRKFASANTISSCFNQDVVKSQEKDQPNDNAGQHGHEAGMTFTSFNDDLADKRSFSRDLKLRGSAHTDIFGVHEGTEIGSHKRKLAPPPTTINSCFDQYYVKSQEKDQPDNNEENEMNGGQNGNEDIVDENTKPVEENIDEEKKEPEPSKRVRVPPGGFSSILW